MAQPDFVPVAPGDRVRTPERMPAPTQWRVDRPGELTGLRPPVGGSFGVPGPDQGYALKLARSFEGRLTLAPGEHAEDAVAGCVGIALKRAARFGRSPVVYDLELAFSLFGFFGDGGAAPADLVEFRRPYFEAASHAYWDTRDIADLVPEETLSLSPADVRARVAAGDWRSLLVTAD